MIVCLFVTGYYCPAGTGYDWQPCPTGTFSNMAGLANETQCTLCSPGKYCSQLNATMVTGDCEAGYFCTEGSDTATPEVTFKGQSCIHVAHWHYYQLNELYQNMIDNRKIHSSKKKKKINIHQSFFHKVEWYTFYTY